MLYNLCIVQRRSEEQLQFFHFLNGQVLIDKHLREGILNFLQPPTTLRHNQQYTYIHRKKPIHIPVQLSTR